MKSYHWLAIILVVYFIIGTGYILLNPLWESPDEIHHYPMVHYLENNRLRLPRQDIGTVGLWQQEGNQPPLYYILGAIITTPIDTSNINEVMRVNPHADIGTIHPDGNLNRLVHQPQIETFPGNGAVLATYVLRFFSLILGAATVAVTYLTANLIFPGKSAIAVGAAGINAFIPMFVYISASVNNDNLSNLLANLLMMLLVSLLLNPKRANWKTYTVVGIVTGAGLLSKLNIGLLIPVVAFVLFVVSIRKRDWKPLVIGGIISGGLTIAIAGWWYWRNFKLFGDPTGLNRFLEIVGQRADPASITQLWTERVSFAHTFWGLFGSISVPMSSTLYGIFNWIGGLAFLVGFITLIIVLVKHPGKRIAVGLILLWTVLVFIAVMRWSSITPASQGRLMYGALSAITLTMACGIGYWLPQRIRQYTLGSIVIFMATVSAIQPFVTIEPAYALPSSLSICEERCPNSDTVFSSSDGAIAVHATHLQTDQVQAGEYIQFTVDFSVVDTLSTDWSIFVHAISPEGIVLAQRDVFAGGGLLATSDLAFDHSWRNFFAVLIPKTTFAPTQVDIYLGWYNLETGARMTVADGTEIIYIGEVDILPTDLAINFGNQVELVGYQISTLSAAPSETIELTLFWRRLQAIHADYVVFANIIDPQSLTKYADSNAMPANWTRPTSTWADEEIIEDRHTLTISGDAIAGNYQIEVGLYLQSDSFPRLPVIGTYDNFVYLTPFRIEREVTE